MVNNNKKARGRMTRYGCRGLGVVMGWTDGRPHWAGRGGWPAKTPAASPDHIGNRSSPTTPTWTLIAPAGAPAGDLSTPHAYGWPATTLRKERGSLVVPSVTRRVEDSPTCYGEYDTRVGPGDAS